MNEMEFTLQIVERECRKERAIDQGLVKLDEVPGLSLSPITATAKAAVGQGFGIMLMQHDSRQ